MIIFCRSTTKNLEKALRDPRCSIFEIWGDILQTDVLDAAMKGVDGVIHLAALLLLQCYDFPRAAFDVNIRGTFNVLETCVANRVKNWFVLPLPLFTVMR
jgi:UDP-glucose 4-epimerase